MRGYHLYHAFFILITWPFWNNGIAQSLPRGVKDKDLFSDDSVFELTIRGDINDLLNDRGNDPQYHQMIVSYKSGEGKEINIVTQIKTRGHFRKLSGNCLYPPLLLNFASSDTLAASVFRNQNKLKLVMPCADDDYVIREMLAYKIYNLLTPVSFKTRLVKLTLFDHAKNKAGKPFYGLFLEEEKQMAKRNGLTAVEWKLKAQQVQREPFITMAMFEYLIGNTDWSVEYLQNIKLVTPDSNTAAIAVPYDFDHAGLVNAPYAAPAPELKLSSIRERRYRGYCLEDMKIYDSAIARFNQLKNDIYAIYTGCSLLNSKDVKMTIRFFDDFYKTINNAANLKREFSYPCNPYGTGNVIIRGLKED